MKKQLVRLTESELHQIIEESVRSIIEENMDEGWFDTAKSFFGQYGKRGAENAKQLGNKVGQQVKMGVNKAQEVGKEVGDKLKQGYNNVKSDIQQTAMNARQDGSMKDMQKAFNNFKSAVEQYKAAGGKLNNQFASRIAGIEKMMGGYQAHF